MTKNELDKFLKDKNYRYDNNNKIYVYNDEEFPYGVYGRYIITITVHSLYNTVEHLIPLKDLTNEKFNVIEETLKEKIKELNKEL